MARVAAANRLRPISTVVKGQSARTVVGVVSVLAQEPRRPVSVSVPARPSELAPDAVRPEDVWYEMTHGY